MAARYCEVALPVPLRSTFTYAVPAALDGEALVGRRVVVPFRNRAMIGVGLAESDCPPDMARAKSLLKSPDLSPVKTSIREISGLMDTVPALPGKLIELGQWMSRYYLAPIGETFRAMLPPEIELRHDREYWLTDAGRAYLEELSSGEEVTATEALERDLLQHFDAEHEAIASARVSGGEAAAEKLVRRGYLGAREVLRKRKTRMQKIVAWNPTYAMDPLRGAGPTYAESAAEDRPGLRDESIAGRPHLCDEPAPQNLSESKRRTSAGRSGASGAEERIREFLTATRGPVPIGLLMKKAEASRAIVERLAKKGRLLIWEEPLTTGEDPWDTDFVPPANELNEEQKVALEEIRGWLAFDSPVQGGKFTAGLLHGVTGSGKTEVYLGAIEAALARGKTAMVLVPEIALTLWMSRLVRARFGAGVAVLHSGLPESERAREWWRVRHGEARVVAGTRSAVFAPLENVGLIIVDEEQESSYKQEETPRYNGRDVAVYRARLEGAVALLGSATPSIETYYNARAGKYRLLTLAARVANRPMARVRIVDLREEFRARHKAAPVSEALREALALRLEEGTQAMVLINRRGYSWSLLCRSCGAFVQCENCS
ncbi:MAG: primosomal protein N', partial [Candidatus Acidiferrales bacterium]